MSDAPERLLLELRQGMTFDAWSECRDPRYAKSEPVEYIRADLSDALLREAMDALQWLREVTEPPDRNCSCHRSAPCGWCEQHAAVAEAHEETRATLAKLWAHLDGRADEGGVPNGI